MHGPNTVEQEDEQVVARRAVIGLRLLAVYSSMYALFIFLCAFFVESFATLQPLGIPLTVWYGLLLMVGAIVLAFVYGRLSR